MKSFHRMAGNVVFAFLAVLIIVILTLPANSVLAGTIQFKMTAPKTTLTVGEVITVTVSAWVNDPIAQPDNGLDTWQLDLSVDNTGVIEITKTSDVADITLLAPNPDSYWSGWKESSVNSPVTGEVREVAVTQQIIGAASYTGVGGYSDIFTFNIIGSAVGTATYTICDDSTGDGSGIYAFLSDESYYEGDDMVFDASGSDNVFTVIAVPEPASFAVFILAGVLAASKRRK